MLNHTVLKAIVKLKLLQLDLSADLSQLLLDVLSVSLGSLLLQLGVRGLNQLMKSERTLFEFDAQMNLLIGSPIMLA